MTYEIAIYRTAAGREPFNEWLENLDSTALAKIDARITRIEKTGNIGDYKSVGDGVFELRIDVGPGYRVYFGFKKEDNLVLLLGGQKQGQQKDINKAKEYWDEYLSFKRYKK